MQKLTKIRDRDGNSAGGCGEMMLDEKGGKGQETWSGSKRPSLLCAGVRGLRGGF